MDSDHDFANLRMISAWSVDHGLVLGQVAVDDDSNEITAVPSLLKVIDVAGCDLTADALHCQTDLAEKIVDAKASYTIAVKANQKTLYHDIITTGSSGLAGKQIRVYRISKTWKSSPRFLAEAATSRF